MKYPVKPGEKSVGRITVFLHGLEKFDNDFARGSDQDLSLACLFGIVLQSALGKLGFYDVVETVVQHGNTSHDCGAIRKLSI